MPLLDHFRPPWGDDLPWDTLHSSWATHVAEFLNKHWLRPPFIACEHRHVGPHMEIDVATFERPARPDTASGNGGGVATLPQVWAPSTAICTVPIIFPDRFEVLIYSGRAPWKLVAAIELVSPGNKDRPQERQAFTTKCAAYLHRGLSVVLIDVVTDRRANLHNEVMRLVNVVDEKAFLPEGVWLYAAAYRPTLRDDHSACEVWAQPCVVGQPLPTLPLWLIDDWSVPVDFEATYLETCRGHQVPM